MNQLSKNTVSAKNQLTPTQFVSFLPGTGDGKRVLYVGNSITRHGIKEDIGWHLDCGMAASEPEKDYVHLLSNAFLQEGPATFCICQGAQWEQEYPQGDQHFPLYERAREFQTDVIIMRLIENCRAENFDAPVFQQQYKKLLDFLNPTGQAQIVLTTSFWHHPGDEAIRSVGRELGVPVVELGDLGEQDEMKAIGLFDHIGVAQHPGDKGMAAIAQRICQVLF